MRFLVVLLLCASLHADEAGLRKALASARGVFTLPPGVTTLKHGIVIENSDSLTVQGAPTGSTLRAADNFYGTALLTFRHAHNLSLTNFTVDGNRARVARPHGLPPSNFTFAMFEMGNGIAIEDADQLRATRLIIREIAGYALLVTRGRNVTLDGLSVSDSGSRNDNHRNNATGGVLLEDGTTDFTVTGCRFERIIGNALWTHSRLDAPRNARGLIRSNTFDTIGRDAIQIGHATDVRVLENRGMKIGYPFDAVDVEGGGVPVGVDTSGNVDQSLYSRNTFDEVNGKCFDLDGFHHSEVSFNTCRNRGGAADYPSGHYGIVFNNNNPQMRSEEVSIHDNTFTGMKYGAVFVLGSRHHIFRNQFLGVNRAGCPESHSKYQCLYFAGQPDILSAGIYLGESAASWSRHEPASGNVIEDNVITGYGMTRRCIASAPAVLQGSNTVQRNQCKDAPR
jgi:hypothetical protein